MEFSGTVAEGTRASEALTFRSWRGSNRGLSIRRSNEAVRRKVSPSLSAAVLRVSASLDLNTVLQEVVESAR